MADEYDSDEASSDSSNSSSSDEEVVQDIPDEDFLKVLSCLKLKDPKIYDKNVYFFSEKQAADNTNEANSKSYDSRTMSAVKEESESDSEDDLTCFNHVPKNIDENKSLKEEITNDQKPESKHLKDCWDEKELDKNELFLKEYILGKKYLDTDEKGVMENEDLSEDEEEIEKQAEYEANYNFRFENEDNLKIKRFPRNVEGSMRRKNDTRSKKRAEIAQRKKEEKEKKHKEIKKKQKEKLSEIEDRLKNLKELTGNFELGFKDEEILEDFDPEKYDQQMKEVFNDEYYDKEEEEYPEFDNEDYWNDDINMDCDAADDEEESGKKLTRTQKKRLRKKKSYKDIMDITKPAFDANVHSDFKKYIDEYYSLDCEDFIDDIPCKFKYREVVPNDYGLTVEEILMADDKELNKWVSTGKISRRRPEHVEKNEVYIYKKKGQDEKLKRKLLPSLFIEQEEINDSQNKLEDSSYDNKCKSKKRKGNDNAMEECKESSQDKLLIEENNDEETEEKNQTKKTSKNKQEEADRNIETLGESITFTSDKDDVKRQTVTKEDNKGNSDKKRKRKKRKKNKNKKDGLIPSPNNTNSTRNEGQSSKETNEKKSIGDRLMDKQGGKKKYKSNKFNNKRFDFKKKKNNVVNLSDSRLQAYGIKPKQFRSKLKYSDNN